MNQNYITLGELIINYEVDIAGILYITSAGRNATSFQRTLNIVSNKLHERVPIFCSYVGILEKVEFLV